MLSASKIINTCKECLADVSRPCICVLILDHNDKVTAREAADQMRKKIQLLNRLELGKARAHYQRCARLRQLATARTYKNKGMVRIKAATKIQKLYRGLRVRRDIYGVDFSKVYNNLRCYCGRIFCTDKECGVTKFIPV